MQNSTLSGSPVARPFQKSLSKFYLCSYLSNITEVKNKANKFHNKQLAWKDFINPFKFSVIAVFRKNIELLRTQRLGTFHVKQKIDLEIGVQVIRSLSIQLFCFSLGNGRFFFPAWGFKIFTFQQPLKVIKCFSVPKAQEWRRKKRHCHNHLVLYSLLEGSRKTFLYKKIV